MHGWLRLLEALRGWITSAPQVALAVVTLGGLLAAWVSGAVEMTTRMAIGYQIAIVFFFVASILSAIYGIRRWLRARPLSDREWATRAAMVMREHDALWRVVQPGADPPPAAVLARLEQHLRDAFRMIEHDLAAYRTLLLAEDKWIRFGAQDPRLSAMALLNGTEAALRDASSAHGGLAAPIWTAD